MKTVLQIVLFPFALLLAIAILLMMTLMWAIGTPINITRKDVKIGILRWFTYTPIKR